MIGNVLVVRIMFQERGDGGLRVYSPDIAGLHLSAADREAVLRDVVPAIKLLFEKNHGLEVEVEPVVRELAHDPLPVIAAMETGQIAVRRAVT